MKILIILLFYFYCIVFHFCDNNDESAPDLCHEDKPFRTNDRRCHSFSNLCFKTGDDQCNQLLNACKQCPPNNFTMAILRDIRNMSKYQSNLIKLVIDKKIPNTFEQFISTMTNKSNVSSPTLTNNSCAILLVIIIIILFVHFLETRFKLFTKCFQQCINTNHLQYALVKSRKRKYQNENLNETFKSKFQELNENLNETFKSKFQELNDKIDQLQITSKAGIHINSASISNNIKFEIIKFQFDDIDQEPIEMYVHNNHNIVQVKQQICNKLPHAKHDDYKIMKLKYNGIILNDDNQYLLENIDKSNAIVNCFIDSSMNTSDIIVVKLQGKMRLPDIIQINKNRNIDQLKEIIGKIINSKDFSLFKQTNGNIQTEDLKDNLKDGDWIRIVTKEFGKLIIRSIFDDEDSITIEYANVDLVSSLMKSISNKYNWDLNNFILFYNNKCLDQGKYIFEYQISSESAVKYCCFMKWAGIKMDDDYITKGNFSELRYGTIEKTNRKILIKKYEVKSSKTWIDEEFMLKELITFQITKSHRRFIQLMGVYIDDATLYVVMENMAKGTLKLFLQENYEKLDKNKIYKWSAQILEGLKFLHENKIIHRNLNPSSILVDGNDYLKLSSFNFSKYLDINKPCSIMTKQDKKEDLPVRYMAPELLTGGNYGEACDVWSFGAVLIRIVTNKKPYSNSNKSEALNQISNLKKIEYKLPDKYSEFKSIIDSCLKYDPILREKIGNLINNENIRNLIK